MSVGWFRLESFYEIDGDRCIFYPSHYARGYVFSAEDRARMDRVLGPFLSERLRFEFIAVFSLVTTALVAACMAYLITASVEQLDEVLAMPAGVWLGGAVFLAAVILVPILLRVRWKVRHQLDDMGLDATEPPRPDFFVVDGEFSPTRLALVFFALGTILALASTWMG